MWKILGKEAMYVEFADVFKSRMIEIASGMEGKEKFVDLMNNSEVMHIFNGSTETHGFTHTPSWGQPLTPTTVLPTCAPPKALGAVTQLPEV